MEHIRWLGRHTILHNLMCVQLPDIYARAFGSANWHLCDLESAKTTLFLELRAVPQELAGACRSSDCVSY